MKQETAEAVADVVLLAAVGLAAWFILRDPRLRRPALAMLKTFATRTIPGVLVREVRGAWEASEPRSMIAR